MSARVPATEGVPAKQRRWAVNEQPMLARPGCGSDAHPTNESSVLLMVQASLLGNVFSTAWCGGGRSFKASVRVSSTCRLSIARVVVPQDVALQLL